MTMEEMLARMPAYALGELGSRETLAISRALPASPELREELRFCLKLRDLLRAAEEEAPPMDLRALAAAPRAISLPEALPAAVREAAQQAGGALSVAGSAVRLAFGFL